MLQIGRRRDLVILGLLGFFLFMGVVVDGYWFFFHDELVERAQTSWLARGYAVYSDADRGYYDRVTKFALALEAVNVFVTQAVYFWLIFAILKNRPYRYALQLTVGTYVAYSVLLYYWVAHLGGYPGMRYRSLYTFFLFFSMSGPWLLGHLFFAYDAAVEIHRRFLAGHPVFSPSGPARG